VSLCLSSGSITFHRGETLDQAQGVLVAERSDLYGEGESRAETLLRRGRERERDKGAAQHVDIDDEKLRKDDHRQMYSYATDSAEYRQRSPPTLDSLLSSTMQMNLSDTTSTIFSLSRAPPPPVSTREREEEIERCKC
jgi:hypothetical protein